MNIRKDTKKGQLTIAETAETAFSDGKVKKLFTFYDSNGNLVKKDMNSDEFESSQDQFRILEQKVEKYNNSIKNLDPLYASLKPIRGIIVRCLHREIKKTDSGIYIPDTIPVYTSTANGLGIVDSQDSPWQLSTKAIVVAVAQGSEIFKPGQFVQLKRSAVTPAVKNLNERSFVLPKGFVHYTCLNETPPSNPEDRHFGYLLIDPYSDVWVILPDDEE